MRRSVNPSRYTVDFPETGRSADVAAGTTLRDAAAIAGVPLVAPCGGQGTCGACTVRVDGALEAADEDERALLTAAQIARGERLSCRARVAGHVTVRSRTAESRFARIVDSFTKMEFEVEPPEARGMTAMARALGAAIDVGTTTLVARLVDLSTGETLHTASELNPQTTFGSDVMSRISIAVERGVDVVREPLARALEGMIDGLVAGSGIASLREIVVCGNPTMTHILLGLDPQPLGIAPYEPAYEGAVETSTLHLGMGGLPDIPVFFVPAISAFVGSDIVAGLLATRLDRRPGVELLVDLGTNGEIVLKTPGGLVATSTAAGPALEGASIEYGMLAQTGAIEHVAVVDGDLDLAVIGGGAPAGICGSGLIDLIAALLDLGIIDETGRLRDDVAGPVGCRVSEGTDGVRVFDISRGVRLTQHDVRQVQLAVAAVAAGISTLLDEAEVSPDDVDAVVVAGGFGFHVSAAALERIGLVPQGWADRISFGGNTALAGALAALVSSAERRRATALSRHARTVDLALRPDFQTRFIAGMTFPPSAG